MDSGVLLGRPGAYRADRPIDTYEIPSTVHAVLATRIDRLPAAQKSLLQTAAVIGRDVPLELLQRIAGLDRDLLLERLASLQSAEFLYLARLVPEPQYTFKHALTHRVAYESILREPRRDQVPPARVRHAAVRSARWREVISTRAGERATCASRRPR